MLPNRPPRLRNLLAVTAIGGLALSGLTSAPAHAAAPITDGSIELSGMFNFDGTDCTGATEPAPVQATFTAGTTVKRTLTFDQTATATGDATDKVRMKGSQTLSVSSTSSGGQITSLTASSTVTGSVSRTKTDSACTPSGFPASANNLGRVQAQVHRSTAGWLRIQATSTGVGGQVVMAAFGGDELVQAQIGGYAVRDLSNDQWVYVPAGDHDIQVQLGGTSADGFGISTTSLKQSVKFTFSPVGVAKAATTGTARAKVLFPNVLTCSTGRATLRLTSKITGASRASLYVNGTRKTTIVRPRARTVTLTGVPRDRAVSLKLVVAERGRTLTATRSYRSC